MMVLLGAGIRTARACSGFIRSGGGFAAVPPRQAPASLPRLRRDATKPLYRASFRFYGGARNSRIMLSYQKVAAAAQILD